jgi:hypothetical protein
VRLSICICGRVSSVLYLPNAESLASRLLQWPIQGIAGAAKVVIENFPSTTSRPKRRLRPTPAARPCRPARLRARADDAVLFFGGEVVIERLAGAVDRQALAVPAGVSGSGESSVVLAHLAPRLDRIGTELGATRSD